MSAANQAVFLSYASQDADAARRIAESLRAAGIEVWFDQSELVGGDAWDQKIRRQINSCALFVPIISQNTQARTEGYFRLEWRLGEQRTFLMAKGRPFIVPIVVDNTRDAEATVPDSFLEVQWSRFPDGNCDAKFAAHVQRLLNWDGSEAPHAPAPAPHFVPTAAPTRRKRRPALLLGAITAIVIGAGVAIWFTTRSKENADASPPAVPSTPALSEADQLVARAWGLMNKPDMARTELEAADNLCKQAAALDPNNADVWAAWSQVDSWYVYHRLDQTPARQDGARTKAARALSLDPNSYEARLAQACYLVREGGGQSAVYDLGDARKLLEALLRENPNEPRALWALGILLRNTGNVAGYRDAFTRMANAPGFVVQAYNELGWAEFFNGNHREAEAAADASIALQPYWANLNLKTNLLAYWWGDLEKARAAADQISGTDRQEDYAVSTMLLLDYFRRDPDSMLRVTNRLARDWLECNAFDGPVAWWNGRARQMAGQADAAQLQWRTALTLVERRLADQPGSIGLLRWRARLLLASGNQSEGATAMRLAREMGSSVEFFYDEATDEILLGNLDGAVTVLEERAKAHELFLTAAYLRLSPEFDRLRDLPRYRALLARLEADPRFSPNAKPAAVASTADDKSIAVLPFENMSDDKDNAFFADGVQEDILTNLSNIHELRVVSRTSVMQYRGTKKTVPEIAKELGVAYVLEGSVRRAGNKVRVTGQLIKAGQDEHVWAKTYDRDLTDIFGIQSELAQSIATSLQAVISPKEKSLIEQKPTDNIAAYDAYTKARQILTAGAQVGFDDLVPLLKTAVLLDPKFTQAWAELGSVYARRYFDYMEHTPEVLANAKDAIDRAVALAPDDPMVVQKLGDYYYYGLRNYPRAAHQYQLLADQYPNYAPAQASLAFINRRLGRWKEALEGLRRAVHLEPRNLRYSSALVETLTDLRRYDEAEAVQREVLAHDGDSFYQMTLWALIAFERNGSTGEFEKMEKKFAADPKRAQAALLVRYRVSRMKGDLESFIQTAGQIREIQGFFRFPWEQECDYAMALKISGDTVQAKALLEKRIGTERDNVEKEPQPRSWMTLSVAYTVLDDDAEALHCAQTAVDLVPESADANEGTRYTGNRAMILAWAGKKDEAIAEVARQLKIPGGLKVEELRKDPFWKSLQGDPRFQALLDDPKNNQPLL